MWQLLFFIILILLIQGLSKVLEKEAKKRKPEGKPATEEEIQDIFETLGFPPVRIPPKKEKPKKIEEKPALKPESKVEVPSIKEEKPVLKPEIPKVKEEILPSFPLEKIEEGIILSEILGRPKALRRGRGAWNW